MLTRELYVRCCLLLFSYSRSFIVNVFKLTSYTKNHKQMVTLCCQKIVSILLQLVTISAKTLIYIATDICTWYASIQKRFFYVYDRVKIQVHAM